jgi:uncharacterized tellurite resistance protein B-like protein
MQGATGSRDRRAGAVRPARFGAPRRLLLEWKPILRESSAFRASGKTLITRIFDQIVAALSNPDPAGSDAGERDEAIRRATAVLMLDVALADRQFDRSELQHLLTIAEAHFGLGPEEAAELIDTARNEAEQLVSLHEFTQLLHNNLSEGEKAAIVGMLWEIACADGRLDKYENALVFKISDLLYVSRGRVMRLKHDAQHAATRD